MEGIVLFLSNVVQVPNYLGRVKRIWYLSPMRAAKVQASLRIRAVSPEPPLLAHTSSESRANFRQKARSLAPLNGWACAVKICHDGMLEDTNPLDVAHLTSFQLLFAGLHNINTKSKTIEPRHEKMCLRESLTRPDTNGPAQPQKLAGVLEISAIESRDIILSKQWKTKALIRLSGCAGWSAPFLFAYDIRHIFSWPGSVIQLLDDLLIIKSASDEVYRAVGFWASLWWRISHNSLLSQLVMKDIAQWPY